MSDLARTHPYPARTGLDNSGRVGCLTLVVSDGCDDTPTATASQEYRQVLAGMELLLADVAHRLEHHQGTGLAGIADVGETVVLYTATTRRAAYGWYCADIWHHAAHGQRFAEIVLNADHLDRPAEEVLCTLVHELVHAYAAATGVKDTSRGGSYHNSRFGELAIRAGLIVERRPATGCFTVGISPLGAAVYADDLLDDLETLLTLHRSPQRRQCDTPTSGGQGGDSPGPIAEPGAATAEAKYVMARCACIGTAGRPITVRVARGSWEPDAIWCRRCDRPFIDPAAHAPPEPTTRS